MNEFKESTPEQISKVRFLDLYMSGHNGFIAGGCFKNIFNKEKIKDIDIFFENESDFNEANTYFTENEDYVFSYENKNTIAHKNIKTNIRIELVRNTYGTPTDILSKFDFSITKFAYCKRTIGGDEFGITCEVINYYCFYHVDFFEHLSLKKLVLESNILFPVSTFERSYRYRGYGFGLCRESKANLINALQGVDTNNISNELYFGLD
jgi:hypothetical protein